MTFHLSPNWLTVAVFAVDALLRFGIGVRVIMRRLPIGVTLAWLMVVLGFPFGGTLIYLLIGELRLGDRRARRAAALHRPYLDWLQDINHRHPTDWSALGQKGEPLARLVEKVVGLGPLPGNTLDLLSGAEAILDSLVADIDRAQRTCHLEFYIWNEGGRANQVEEALLRAVTRGVKCRVLLDAVGSHDFLASEGAHRLIEGGVHLHSALRVSLFRMLFVRFDLRLHRKIVVIDGEVAYTGSMNLVDPRYFKVDAHVGAWVDAMVRVQGPAVEALAVTFLEDWALETGEDPTVLHEPLDVHTLPKEGSSPVQVFGSGPMHEAQAIESVLLQAIYSAQHELVLTTPYFVPDEPMSSALVSAALRGVEVTLVMPAQVDSKLVRLASQTCIGDLARAGVRVLRFEGGLLHTKSVTIDGELSLFGSLNLDPRSFHLNFEITLLVYDADFTSRLRRLQTDYFRDSRAFDLTAWQRRTGLDRFTENVARLLSPLL